MENQPTAPAEVSRRESDVLALLGEHLTNAEIAQRLHVSVRTVESHVSSLLRKLGLADRRALATLAGEQSAAGGRAGQLVGAPSVTTPFVGRVRERGEVRAALDGSRLVTLVGPGGIGKTRLAIAVADEAAPGITGGVTFVDLVPVRGRFLVQAVAAALGIAERPGQELESTLFGQLRGRPSLIVLDNCEHVLDVVAPFVDRLLAACSDVSVLATSRERLAVPAERAISVPPLSLVAPSDGAETSDAATLFVNRARAVDDSTEYDLDVIAELCARLDGMPLAIELAAARSASLGNPWPPRRARRSPAAVVRRATRSRTASLAARRDRVEPRPPRRAGASRVPAARCLRRRIRSRRRGVGRGRRRDACEPGRRPRRPPRRQEPGDPPPVTGRGPVALARDGARVRARTAGRERRGQRSARPPPRVEHRSRRRPGTAYEPRRRVEACLRRSRRRPAARPCRDCERTRSGRPRVSPRARTRALVVRAPLPRRVASSLQVRVRPSARRRRGRRRPANGRGRRLRRNVDGRCVSVAPRRG